MKCPRTNTALKEATIQGITINYSEGCGGVWFDRFEFEKFDEVKESAGQELISLIEPFVNNPVETSDKLHSPKHPEVVMMRRYLSPARKIEIDECPQCAGIWLDPGELAGIRKLYPTEQERKAAVCSLVGEMVNGEEFTALKQASQEDQTKVKRFVNMFKWICPSAYLPGDQDWGSF